MPRCTGGSASMSWSWLFGEDLASLYLCCTAMYFPSGSTHFLAEFWVWIISKAKLLATLISLWNVQDWENSLFVPHDSTKPWLNSFLLLCHTSSAVQIMEGENPPDGKDFYTITRDRRRWGPYFSVCIKLLFCFPMVAHSFIWVVLMFPSLISLHPCLVIAFKWQHS